MKKYLLIMVFLFAVSCGEDCEIDSAKIVELSAKKTEIKNLHDLATTQALKDIYQKQLDEIDNQIADVANQCN